MFETNLTSKWEKVLDHESQPKIADDHRRNVTAILLENQNISDAEMARKDPTQSMTYITEGAPANVMGASSSTAASGSVDIFDPVMISMVRRSMPNLMAYDVCGVQPMTQPTGLVFALRSRYGSQVGAEALFAEANTTFGSSDVGNTIGAVAQTGSDPSTLITTGTNPQNTYTVARGMTTAQGELLGSGSTAMNEMALSIEKIAVNSQTLKLRASYSHELSQDMKNVHGMDAEKELANMVTHEMLAEMNRSVIRSIYQTSKVGAANTNNPGIYDMDADTNGRWMVEKFKGLMFQVEREANSIAKDIRSGKGNFIITSSDVASAFAMSGLLDYQSALTTGDRLNVDDTGNTFAGTLFGRVKVYVDPYFQTSAGNHFVTVGYKGQSAWDAGMFLCPYVPLQMYKAIDPQSYQPSIGFATRFGMVAHPFATDDADGQIAFNKKNKYYRTFAVTNLQ